LDQGGSIKAPCRNAPIATAGPGRGEEVKTGITEKTYGGSQDANQAAEPPAYGKHHGTRENKHDVWGPDLRAVTVSLLQCEGSKSSWGDDIEVVQPQGEPEHEKVVAVTLEKRTPRFIVSGKESR